MSKNARMEMRDAVFSAFREGMDKHGDKQSGIDTMAKIYSHKTKFQLLDRIDDFSKYLKNEGINRVEKVTSDVLVGYIAQKKVEGCTQWTLDEYRYEIKKIGVLLGYDWRVDRIRTDRDCAPDRGAKDVISPKDLSKILDYCKEHPSKSAICIRLEVLIGVRAGDLAYGVEIIDDNLRIKSKNGKYAYRVITPAIQEILNDPICQSMIEDGHLRAPKSDSINRYLSRLEKKMGMEPHSMHAIRRRIAQDKYDIFRSSGMTKKEALDAVSRWLNHGKDREDMLKRSYIANIW